MRLSSARITSSAVCFFMIHSTAAHVQVSSSFFHVSKIVFSQLNGLWEQQGFLKFTKQQDCVSDFRTLLRLGACRHGEVRTGEVSEYCRRTASRRRAQIRKALAGPSEPASAVSSGRVHPGQVFTCCRRWTCQGWMQPGLSKCCWLAASLWSMQLREAPAGASDPADSPDGEPSIQALVLCYSGWIGQNCNRSEWLAIHPRRHTSAAALAGMSAAECYISTTSTGRTTHLFATVTYLLHPQRLCSGQVATFGQVTARQRELDANARRRRVRCGGEGCLSGSLDGATGLGRVSQRPLACAGCSRVQQRPPRLADTAHAASQSSAEQPGAGTAGHLRSILVEQRQNRSPHKTDTRITLRHSAARIVIQPP